MGKTYGEKLKDPRWQRMRLKVLERDEWKCRRCGDGASTLHVHHAYYVSGRNPWEYPPLALAALCEACHEADPEFGALSHDALMRAGQALRFERGSTPIGRLMAAQLLVNALCAWLDAEETGMPGIAWLDECAEAISFLRGMQDAQSSRASGAATEHKG